MLYATSLGPETSKYSRYLPLFLHTISSFNIIIDKFSLTTKHLKHFCSIPTWKCLTVWNVFFFNFQWHFNYKTSISILHAWCTKSMGIPRCKVSCIFYENWLAGPTVEIWPKWCSNQRKVLNKHSYILVLLGFPENQEHHFPLSRLFQLVLWIQELKRIKETIRRIVNASFL